MWDNRSTQHYAVMDYAPCHRKMERAASSARRPTEPPSRGNEFQRLSSASPPELPRRFPVPRNQDKLVITAAPYGPEDPPLP
jgi:hypothetical protein